MEGFGLFCVADLAAIYHLARRLWSCIVWLWKNIFSGWLIVGGWWWSGWNPYLQRVWRICLVQSSVWRAPKDSGSQSIDFSPCSFIRLGVTWSDQDVMSWNCVYIMWHSHIEVFFVRVIVRMCVVVGTPFWLALGEVYGDETMKGPLYVLLLRGQLITGLFNYFNLRRTSKWLLTSGVV